MRLLTVCHGDGIGEVLVVVSVESPTEVRVQSEAAFCGGGDPVLDVEES